MESENAIINQYLELIYPKNKMFEHEYDLMMTNFKRFLEGKEEYIFFPNNYEAKVDQHTVYLFGESRIIELKFREDHSIRIELKQIDDIKSRSMSIDRNGDIEIELGFEDETYIHLDEKPRNYILSPLVSKSMKSIVEKYLKV